MSKQHQIALTLIEGVGPLIAKKLLQYFGSAADVFTANQKQLQEIEGIGKKTAETILQTNALELAEKELEFINRHQIKVLFYEDEDYPKRLKNCYDSPLLLYYKGTTNLNASKVVSIVGTRNATPYGKMLCKQLIEVLKPYQVLIVSGLAYGIDAAAHKESVLQAVPTIGILGHGLDRIYPATHRELAANMLKCGGLLTEFLPGTKPDRENFPKRNRIIAGMADVTIVVEASSKGGALITAEIANSYNRDVYAFPGRVNDEFSEGCNFLIKTNRAGLINSPQDLIYYLGWDGQATQAKPPVQVQLPLDLNREERIVCEALLPTALPVDELALKTNIAQSKLAVILLTLEMKGIIVALPGKLFKLVP
ncbi:DNA-processing protein DprA [Pedobacter sp.]|uniref:DNA-processing protein DprA n=1 Tax=Pedobacter sp. TaxID=1411316 RepID=UPI0031D05D2A